GAGWVAPDAELVPTPLAEAIGDQPAPSTSDIEPVGGADLGPVTDSQLRAPWRWERLLVEAAVIGGRQRWRARIEGLANDLRIKFAALVDEDEARAALSNGPPKTSTRLPHTRCLSSMPWTRCPSRRTGASGSTNWERLRPAPCADPTGSSRCSPNLRRWPRSGLLRWKKCYWS